MAKSKSNSRSSVEPQLHRCDQRVSEGKSGSTSLRFNFTPDKNLIFISALLFSFVVAVFLPSVRNDFLHWFGDDPLYVTENVHVNSGLTLENIRWAFSSVDHSNWHPLTWISHMLDCQIFGLKPWGHHLSSVLFHAANTMLLFIVLRRMTGAVWRSLVVALLFGLHPLRVESVAWISARKDVLSVFFWMLTLLMYTRYVKKLKSANAKTNLFYALALLCFAFGLMSKGMVVTLPFVLLLLDYWPLQRFQEKNAFKLILEKLPFFFLTIATSAVTYVAQKNWGFVQTLDKFPLDVRFGNAMVSFFRYLGKMFWPVNLSGFYPHPGKWPATTVLLAVTFLIGISILAFVMRRKGPWLLVGWFWYLGTLVPVIGFVQLGDIAMADRYSYIPMIGILTLLVWGFHEATKGWRHRVAITWGLVFTALLACSITTQKQIGFFKDGVTAWRHNFEVTHDIDVAEYALGLALDKQGHTDEGIKHLEVVLKKNPERAEVHYNIANMFYRQLRTEEAIRHFSEAIRLSPGSVDAHHNLGTVLLQKERFEEASYHLREALNLDTRNFLTEKTRADVYMNLAILSNRYGDQDEAIEHYRQAIKLAPDFAEARYNLGINLLDKGLTNEATLQFLEVLKHKRDAKAYNGLGTVAASAGRLDEASNYFQAAIKEKPDYIEAHNNLGISLTDLERIDEAIRQFEEALRLDPNSTIARTYLDSLRTTRKAPNP